MFYINNIYIFFSMFRKMLALHNNVSVLHPLCKFLLNFTWYAVGSRPQVSQRLIYSKIADGDMFG